MANILCNTKGQLHIGDLDDHCHHEGISEPYRVDIEAKVTVEFFIVILEGAMMQNTP